MIRNILFILCFTTLISCSKDEDLVIPGSVNPEATANVPVQDFMWKAMNFWYFWQQDVPKLADDAFLNTEEGVLEYTNFLMSKEDPADFFRNALQFSEDNFSFFEEDYTHLIQSLSGVSRSNGVEFALMTFNNSNEIYGVVRYILPNSDAATKDIKRGDIFTGVNGQTLTASNFRALLFGADATYTLNMAVFEEGAIAETSKTVTLTKETAFAENPIFLTKIIEAADQKIGYLVYNQFVRDYDDALYKAVSELRDGGITDLVVDLRYNPGGSVNSTRLLASMIYGTNSDDLFLKKRYNSKIQAQLEKDQLEIYFTSKVGSTTINSLELKKVYVLTTSASASASELLINCLDPYMNVVHIGDVTTGKNEFSTTMVDDRENTYLYSPSRINKIKEGNKWAIQPLIGRNENSVGFSDYTEGINPDIILKEDIANLGVLGATDEPLLARAIQEITGVITNKRKKSVPKPFNTVYSSKMNNLLKDNMVDDTHY